MAGIIVKRWEGSKSPASASGLNLGIIIATITVEREDIDKYQDTGYDS
jgi:hypothetical protein